MSRSIIAGVALLAASGPVFAQSTFGVVLGEVRDSSGGLVRGAAVRLTNTAENTTRETTSDTAGNFEFQNVKAGP